MPLKKYAATNGTRKTALVFYDNNTTAEELHSSLLFKHVITDLALPAMPITSVTQLVEHSLGKALTPVKTPRRSSTNSDEGIGSEEKSPIPTDFELVNPEILIKDLHTLIREIEATRPMQNVDFDEINKLLVAVENYHNNTPTKQAIASFDSIKNGDFIQNLLKLLVLLPLHPELKEPAGSLLGEYLHLKEQHQKLALAKVRQTKECDIHGLNHSADITRIKMKKLGDAQLARIRKKGIDPNDTEAIKNEADSEYQQHMWDENHYFQLQKKSLLSNNPSIVELQTRLDGLIKSLEHCNEASTLIEQDLTIYQLLKILTQPLLYHQLASQLADLLKNQYSVTTLDYYPTPELTEASFSEKLAIRQLSSQIKQTMEHHYHALLHEPELESNDESAPKYKYPDDDEELRIADKVLPAFLSPNVATILSTIKWHAQLEDELEQHPEITIMLSSTLEEEMLAFFAEHNFTIHQPFIYNLDGEEHIDWHRYTAPKLKYSSEAIKQAICESGGSALGEVIIRFTLGLIEQKQIDLTNNLREAIIHNYTRSSIDGEQFDRIMNIPTIWSSSKAVSVIPDQCEMDLFHHYLRSLGMSCDEEAQSTYDGI